MNEMNFIIDGIYLGSERAATNLELLEQYDITAILSVQAEAYYKDLYPPHFLYKHLPLLDGQIIDALVFEEALKFISMAQKECRNILVHCAVGVSRSPSIVSAYLMKIKGMNPLEALNFLRKKRPVVQPAVECFLSAVDYAYPDVIWRCTHCGGRWVYWSLWWLESDEMICDCHVPSLQPEQG